MPDFILKNAAQPARFVLPVAPITAPQPQPGGGLVDDFDNWLADDDGKILTQ